MHSIHWNRIKCLIRGIHHWLEMEMPKWKNKADVGGHCLDRACSQARLPSSRSCWEGLGRETMGRGALPESWGQMRPLDTSQSGLSFPREASVVPSRWGTARHSGCAILTHCVALSSSSVKLEHWLRSLQSPYEVSCALSWMEISLPFCPLLSQGISSSPIFY